jgi:hypothetical protein
MSFCEIGKEEGNVCAAQGQEPHGPTAGVPQQCSGQRLVGPQGGFGPWGEAVGEKGLPVSPSARSQELPKELLRGQALPKPCPAALHGRGDEQMGGAHGTVSQCAGQGVSPSNDAFFTHADPPSREILAFLKKIYTIVLLFFKNMIK